MSIIEVILLNRKFTTNFFDEFIELGNIKEDFFAYIFSRSSKKNVIYLNRPKHIQIFAEKIASLLPEIEATQIGEVVDEIQDATHEEYLLLKCIRRGVLYHHGSMSESIRNYVEFIYRSTPEIKYLVTSSTLLEGVNLPVDRMFVLSLSKGLRTMSSSQFKKLIGRVSRFGDVFSKPGFESLRLLQPEIHIVATESYMRKNANLESFCKQVLWVDKKDTDKIENVLLENSVIDEKKKSDYDQVMTRLCNLEPGIFPEYAYRQSRTIVGKSLLKHSISEINAIESEVEITGALKNQDLINSSNDLMRVIYECFVRFIDKENRSGSKSLVRLESDKAQTFYAMFVDWMSENTPMSLMISRFLRYWSNLPADTPVYVGSWGDQIKEGGYQEVYTYIEKKSKAEKINLAIVRIKEEEDFLQYNLLRYVEVLNDVGLINEDFYKIARYGTNDVRVISLMKNGYSRKVSELLLRKYARFVKFLDDDIVEVDPSVLHLMKRDKIGFLQRHELSLNNNITLADTE